MMRVLLALILTAGPAPSQARLDDSATASAADAAPSASAKVSDEDLLQQCLKNNAAPAGGNDQDERFLKGIQAGAGVALEQMQKDGCKQFEADAFSKAQRMHQARACANVHAEPSYEPRLLATQQANGSLASVGFKLNCMSPSSIDRLSNHHLGLAPRAATTGNANRVAWKTGEVEKICESFIRDFEQSSRDFLPLIQDIQSQRENMRGGRPSHGESKISVLSRKLNADLERFLEEKRRKCIATADSLIQNNPLLKYIKTFPVADADLESARKRCEIESKSAKESIAKISISPISSGAIPLIFYSPFAAELVRRDPKFCGSYRRLHARFEKEAKARNQWDAVLMGGSLVTCGASVIFPVMAAGCYLTGGVSALKFGYDGVQYSSISSTLKAGQPLGVERKMASDFQSRANQAPFDAALAAAGLPVVRVLRAVAGTAAPRIESLLGTAPTIADKPGHVSHAASYVLPKNTKIIYNTDDAFGASTNGVRTQGKVAPFDSALPNVDATPLNAVIGNINRAGNAGIPMIGRLSDGSTVVMRTVDMSGFIGPGARPSAALLKMARPFVEGSARGQRLLSDLGIGPRFHGMTSVTDPKTGLTRLYSVTDAASGDFPVNMKNHINSQTFKDIEHVISRVRERSGRVQDLQYLVDKKGRISVIDPSDSLIKPVPVDAVLGLQEATYVRADLISNATNEAAIVGYLRSLRLANTSEYRALSENIQGNPRLRRLLMEAERR